MGLFLSHLQNSNYWAIGFVIQKFIEGHIDHVLTTLTIGIPSLVHATRAIAFRRAVHTQHRARKHEDDFEHPLQIDGTEDLVFGNSVQKVIGFFVIGAHGFGLT
jgi:hypothetical protein